MIFIIKKVVLLAAITITQDIGSKNNMNCHINIKWIIQKRLILKILRVIISTT